MKSIPTVIGAVIIVIGLAAIRAFEQELFYDPLIRFFRSDFQFKELPEVNTTHLLLYTALRYTLNSLLSLCLIWLLFKKKDILKLSLIIYLLFFLVGLITFYVLLMNPLSNTYFALFYTRRFLIQPLLILILIPAFYFHGRSR